MRKALVTVTAFLILFLQSALILADLPEKEDLQYGDVSDNGRVSAFDASIVSRASKNLPPFVNIPEQTELTADQKRIADVSGNGALSGEDASLILQRAVGLIETFPIEQTVPLDKAYQYLYEKMDQYLQGDQLRLIESYAAPYPPEQADKAWIYDNALAIEALLIRGREEDIRRAKILCQSLLWLQQNDPSNDGRLRDAYRASDIGVTLGLPQIAESSTSLGNLSWVILSFLHYYEYSQDTDIEFQEQLLNSAMRIGEFIAGNLKDANHAGYLHHLGVTYKSIEQNIDAYAAFIWLYHLTRDKLWQERADSSRRLIEELWNESAGHFWVGAVEDGSTPNDDPSQQALDVQSLAILTFGGFIDRARLIQWTESHCFLSRDGFSGFDFNTDVDGIWLEGTAQMALAYCLYNQANESQFLLDEIEKAQHIGVNSDTKGIIATPNAQVTTGFGWSFYPSRHIAATSWYLFAKQEKNPFWPEDVTIPEVSVTAPMNGQTLQVLFPIEAEAHDNFAVTQVEFYLDGELKHTDSVEPYAWEMDPAGYSNGAHTLTVKAYDPLANVNQDQLEFIIDNTPPNSPQLNPVVSPTNEPVILLSGTKDPQTSIWVNGAQAVPVNEETTWSSELALVEGENILSVTARDGSGRFSEPVTPLPRVFLDTTAPSRPIVIDDGEYTASPSQLHVVWNAEDEQTAIAEYQYAIGTTGGESDVVGWISAGTQEEITHTGLLLVSGEDYYVCVKARNGAGSWSQTGCSDGIALNQNLPAITNIQRPGSGRGYSGNNVDFSVTAQDADGDPLSYQFLVDGEVIQPWQTSPVFNWITAGITPGIHTIQVSVNDQRSGIVSQNVEFCLFRKPMGPPSQ